MKCKIFSFVFFASLLSLGICIQNEKIELKKGKQKISQMTENGPFLTFCQTATLDPKTFSHFKRHPLYTIFHENRTYHEGAGALKLIQRDSPELLETDILENVRRLDCVGNPQVHTFEPVGPFSPTTLIYLKVAADLKNLVGSAGDLRVIEVGGGSGGLCKVLHDVLDIEHYTIVDLPESAELVKKHLQVFGLDHVHFITPTEVNLEPYDLVVSYTGFTEASSSLQKRYIRKLLPNASMGYLICNFYPRQVFAGALNKEELIQKIQAKCGMIDVASEELIPDENSCIIKWGK